MLKMILIFYIIFVGYIGSLGLYLSYDYPYITWWKRLREELNIFGCIIIYLLSLPAIIITVLADLVFLIILPFIINNFEKIFRRRR